MKASEIILGPVVTEKSNLLKEAESKKYVFKVSPKANKIQVMKAVGELFFVTPVACNVINVDGKKKANTPVSRNSFKRGYGRTSSWKKAIVTLKAGEKIDLFEGA